MSRIERLSPLRSYVCDRLAQGWSPEQIAGRLEQEGSEHSISHKSVYRFIYRPRLRRERKTRFTFTAPLPSKQAETTDDALRGILGLLPEPARRSVTFDNGSEFALHENLNAELATKTYFCDPHSPLAARHHRKHQRPPPPRHAPKTNLHDYTARDIDDLTWAINSTPRKSLGFKTPAEAFLENLRCCSLDL